MSLRVIPEACRMAQDLSQGTIVIESDVSKPPYQAAFDELQSTDAKNLAMTFAATQGGMGQAHLNGIGVSVFPVNKDGVPLDQVRGPDGGALDPKDQRMQPYRYRTEVQVARPFR